LKKNEAAKIKQRLLLPRPRTAANDLSGQKCVLHHRSPLHNIAEVDGPPDEVDEEYWKTNGMTFEKIMSLQDFARQGLDLLARM